MSHLLAAALIVFGLFLLSTDIREALEKHAKTVSAKCPATAAANGEVSKEK